MDRASEIIEKYTGGAIGIYNMGQLILEEYYILACVMEAGVHTPHMDGNTRLCTATAAHASVKSFGSLFAAVLHPLSSPTTTPAATRPLPRRMCW